MRVILVAPKEQRALRNGVLMGAEEARRTLELLGRSISLLSVDDVDDIKWLADAGNAIVSRVDDSRTLALARRAHAARIPLLDLGNPGESVRRQLCGSSAFHMLPGAMMRSGVRSEDQTIEAWHPSLFRYGAAQLNDRYRARFGGEAMSSDAWYGWMAVKVLSEGALRSGAASSADLVNWLASSRARFDGHKGVPLTFRARDRQFRHPLYLLDSTERVVGELPGSARGDEKSFAERYDEFAPADAACPEAAL